MSVFDEFFGRKIIGKNDALIRKCFGFFLSQMVLAPEIKKVEKLLLLDSTLFRKRWQETVRLIGNNNEIKEDLEIATLLFEKGIDEIVFTERDIQYCRAFYIVVLRAILGADLRVAKAS